MRLGYTKEECIYVGDTVADIQMAKNANMKVVCVKTGIQNNDLLLKESPDYFVDNLHHVVKSLSDNVL